MGLVAVVMGMVYVWGERGVLEVIVHYKTIDQGVDSRLAIGCVDGRFFQMSHNEILHMRTYHL